MKINGKTLAIAGGVALAAWLLRERLRRAINGAIWFGGL